MNTSAQLTLEQQFKLRILSQQVQELTHSQAQEYLIEMFRQMREHPTFAISKNA
ncbi:MAG: NblA/ycf18 family protein [Xenococcaceae cyanobacterium MO_188.B32]|nr:NblA/ycf18 family protein [Xenococcaceae cyanobacterium MO_188.B32]